MNPHPAYLWITRDRPFAPNYGGDWIYSSQMIAAVAKEGANIVVLTHGGGGAPPVDFTPSVAWRSTKGPPPPAQPSMLLSPLPAIAARHASPRMRKMLDEALQERKWDAVVIDHIGAGWAADAVRRSGAPMVYLSQNHEASVRTEVARSAVASPLKKVALMIDAAKVAPLERRLVEMSSLVGAVTHADESLFRREHPGQRYIVLPPGYDGPRVAARDPAFLPRGAVVLGSFGWVAKQANLLRFLAVAADRFAQADARLTVVGAMPAELRNLLAERHPTVILTGGMDDVSPWLDQARLGIIAEETGGGFKLKALSYIFSRVPIAAIDGSYAGLPVTADESILSFPDLSALAAGSLAAVDDVDRLRTVQNAAFAACDGQFRWADRGRALFEALDDIRV